MGVFSRNLPQVTLWDDLGTFPAPDRLRSRDGFNNWADYADYSDRPGNSATNGNSRNDAGQDAPLGANPFSAPYFCVAYPTISPRMPPGSMISQL